jgi:hypothetical protein
MNIFLENVGVYKLWEPVTRDLQTILVARANEDRAEMVMRVLEMMCAEREWMPIIGAWRMFTHHSARDDDVEELLRVSDYRALDYVTDVARIVARLHAYCKCREMARNMQELVQWSDKEPVATNLARFAIFTVLRISDPRPHLLPARDTSEPPPELPKTANKRELMCRIICQCARAIRATIPEQVANDLIERARACAGCVVDNAEERAIARVSAGSALFCDPKLSAVDAARWLIRAQLRADTFIGFNGTRTVILEGPITEDIARRTLNIARIARALDIPRDDGAFMCARVSTLLYIAHVAPGMGDIPATILRPVDIVRNFTQDALRAYITNCMWRFVMNFAGSASADILALAGDEKQDLRARIFSYNEREIGASARAIALVHRAILCAFARDSAYYMPIARNWASLLRQLARVECAICSHDSARTSMTRIDYALLSQCAGRAEIVCGEWMRQLKNNCAQKYINDEPNGICNRGDANK